MGRHEAPASVATFDQAVSDYVTGRARELVREVDEYEAGRATISLPAWVGSAAEILRELTRDA